MFAVKTVSPFPRAEFIPPFVDFAALRGQSIGLTGQRGVLGGILLEQLSQHGIAVAAFAGNINDEAAVLQWFSSNRFTHCFHFAAVVPVALVERDPVLAFQTNVFGAFNVCKGLAATQPACWLFHSSSSHVYQPTLLPTGLAEDSPTVPRTFYGATKLAAEQTVNTLLTRLKVPYCIGRIFSFSHPRQQGDYLVPSLQRKIESLPPGAALEVSNPSSVRDIQDAGQVIDCILQLARARAAGTVNIGTGTGLSVREIAAAVARALGRSLEISGLDRDLPGSLIADTRRLKRLMAQ
jgi:nucleoside-diphosphate-sugar epimerase